MTGRLLIVGAGGHGKVCAELAMMNYYREIVFVDDEIPAGSTVLDFPVVGKVSELEDLQTEEDEVFVAIGDNRQRREVFRMVAQSSARMATLCEPSAIISPSAVIGRGVLLMPRVVVNACAIVREGSILNTGSIVEHDCEVGAFSHVSPGVCLGGGVRVGEDAHLGLGAIVLPNITVGAGSVVGAGCVVNKDLPADVVAVGVPARIIHNADSIIQSEYYRSREESSARRAVHISPFPG